MNDIDSFIRAEVAAGWRRTFPPELDASALAANQLWSRRRFPFHAAGSVFVITPDLGNVLLIHHRTLDQWLQPGGHLEVNEYPVEAAFRELREETGIDIPGATAARLARPVSIDVHAIPANPKKGEPAHWHIDFRYLAVYEGPVTAAPGETNGFAWRPLRTAPVIDEIALSEIAKMRGST